MRDEDDATIPDVVTSRHIDALFRGEPIPVRRKHEPQSPPAARLTYDLPEVRHVIRRSRSRAEAAERLGATDALIVELAAWAGVPPPPAHTDEVVLRSYLSQSGSLAVFRTATALGIPSSDVTDALTRGPGPRPSGVGTGLRVDVDVLLSEQSLSDSVDEPEVPPYRFWTWLVSAATHLGRAYARQPVPKPAVSDKIEDALLATAIRGVTANKAADELSVSPRALRATLPRSFRLTGRPGGTGHAINRAVLLDPHSRLEAAVSNDVWVGERHHDWLRHVAELLGRAPASIPPYEEPPPAVDAETAIATYALEGRTIAEAAQHLGLSMGHLRHSLLALGVPIRPPGMRTGGGIDRAVLADESRPLSDAMEIPRLQKAHHLWLTTIAVALGRDPATLDEWKPEPVEVVEVPIEAAVQHYAFEGHTLRESGDFLGVSPAQLRARLQQDDGPGSRPMGVPAIAVAADVLHDEARTLWDAVPPDTRPTPGHEKWLAQLRAWLKDAAAETSIDSGAT